MDSETVLSGSSGAGGWADGSNTSSPGGGQAPTGHGFPATYPPPRTRQRVYKAPPPLAVPDINEDAAERKRVLNVLAQRRYRERKRQKKKAATSGSTDDGGAPDKASPARSGGTSGSSGPETEVSLEEFMGAIDSRAPEEALDMFFPEGTLDPSSPWTAAVLGSSPLGSPFAGVQMMPGLLAAADSPDDAAGGVPLAGVGVDQHSAPGAFMTGGIDPFSLSISSRDPSSPSSANSAVSADSYLLPVNELKILTAIHRISQRLNVTSFWDLDAASPFITGTAAAATSLPAAWRPTPSQLTVSHHPIIDFLPWPGVRERLIEVMSLPDEARPKAASGPLALVNFAYDAEDAAEGMRIWGEDIFDPECWEVGQVLFERWWFLFDRGIVENSNRWRRLRGASTLKPAVERSVG